MFALDDLPLDVTITAADCDLRATLTVPARARGLVIVAHPHWFHDHRPLTRALQARNLATLRVELCGWEGRNHDTSVRVERLLAVTEWARQQSTLRGQPIGYLGIGDCAAASLMAVERQPGQIAAVVSYGEEHSVVAPLLPWLDVPTLLIADDVPHVAEPLRLSMRHRLVAPPFASGRINDPVRLAKVATLADEWLASHLQTAAAAEAPRDARARTMSRQPLVGKAA